VPGQVLDDGCHHREGLYDYLRLRGVFPPRSPSSGFTASPISRKFLCSSRITTETALALLPNTASPAELRVKQDCNVLRLKQANF
jgi:hypothetical protein